MTEVAEDLTLYIGCGPVNLPGRVNIEVNHTDPDVHVDITKGIPYPDSSVSFIFAKHSFKHLPRPFSANFFRECRRVLRGSRVVRLTTPDLVKIIDAYLSRDCCRWGDFWQPSKPGQTIYETFYSWGHQSLYNRSEMITLLKSSGIEHFHWREHRVRAFPEPNNLEAWPYHNEIKVEVANADTHP